LEKYRPDLNISLDDSDSSRASSPGLALEFDERVGSKVDALNSPASLGLLRPIAHPTRMAVAHRRGLGLPRESKELLGMPSNSAVLLRAALELSLEPRDLVGVDLLLYTFAQARGRRPRRGDVGVGVQYRANRCQRLGFGLLSCQRGQQMIGSAVEITEVAGRECSVNTPGHVGSRRSRPAFLVTADAISLPSSAQRRRPDG
jgi:hypothetical protein